MLVATLSLAPYYGVDSRIREFGGLAKRRFVPILPPVQWNYSGRSNNADIRGAVVPMKLCVGMQFLGLFGSNFPLPIRSSANF